MPVFKARRRSGHIIQYILRIHKDTFRTTFGHVDVTSTKTSKPVRVIVIYRPLTSSLTSFLDELSTYLSEVVVTQCDILITGDFNIHFELKSASGVEKLLQIMYEHGLQQNVHTLDLIISRISNSI